jgi:protein-S-isoprenylcysteine O-methyltransferase Ste14
MTDKDTPGVVAPPPLIFLGAIAAVFAVDAFAPLPLRPAGVAAMLTWAVGAGLIVLGVALMTLGVVNFTRAGTPVPTRAPTQALVTGGVHALSRNPIYVGMFLIYFGAGTLANSAWMFVVFVPLALVMRYGVVAREEAYLERKFGEVYRAYKTRVRRWL